VIVLGSTSSMPDSSAWQRRAARRDRPTRAFERGGSRLHRDRPAAVLRGTGGGWLRGARDTSSCTVVTAGAFTSGTIDSTGRPRAGWSRLADSHDSDPRRSSRADSCFTWNRLGVVFAAVTLCSSQKGRHSSRRAFWIRCVTRGLVEPWHDERPPRCVARGGWSAASPPPEHPHRGPVPANVVPIPLPTSHEPPVDKSFCGSSVDSDVSFAGPTLDIRRHH
jgi:hypothetical protein